jgi:flagellar assembly factor FliW
MRGKTMAFKTTRFGEVEFDDTVITFADGIPGFEEFSKYKLFHNIEAGESPFLFWLQSLEDPDLAFHVIDPFAFGFNYEFVLTDEEAKSIDADKTEDLAILLMVSKVKVGDGTPEEKIKAHVTNPLVINLSSRKGFQKQLRNIDYDLTIKCPEKDD